MEITVKAKPPGKANVNMKVHQKLFNLGQPYFLFEDELKRRIHFLKHADS